MFSALPPVIRAMSDIEAVLKYINSCVGNDDDERFKPLVSYREGKRRDSNGKVLIILRITTMILTGEKRVSFYDSERNAIQCDDCVL